MVLSLIPVASFTSLMGQAHLTNVASTLPTKPMLEQAHPSIHEIEPQAGAEARNTRRRPGPHSSPCLGSTPYLLIGTVLEHLDGARTDEDISAAKRERTVSPAASSMLLHPTHLC